MQIVGGLTISISIIGNSLLFFIDNYVPISICKKKATKWGLLFLSLVSISCWKVQRETYCIGIHTIVSMCMFMFIDHSDSFVYAVDISIILLFDNSFDWNDHIDLTLPFPLALWMYMSVQECMLRLVAMLNENIEEEFDGVITKSRRDKRKEHKYELTGQREKKKRRRRRGFFFVLYMCKLKCVQTKSYMLLVVVSKSGNHKTTTKLGDLLLERSGKSY